MNRSVLALVSAAASGILFGIGLSIARMTDPQKIWNFLDLAAIPSGGWDPSLAFVMGGGVLVGLVGLRLDQWLRMTQPIAAPAFIKTSRTKVDRAARRRRGDLRRRLGSLRLLPRPVHRRSRPRARRRLLVRHCDVRRLVDRGPVPGMVGTLDAPWQLQPDDCARPSPSSAAARSASPRRWCFPTAVYDVALVAPASPPADQRTSALLAGSVALLERVGVWRELSANAAPLRTMRIVDGTRRLIRAPEVTFDSSEIGLAAFGHNVANAALVAALERAIADAAYRAYRGNGGRRSRSVTTGSSSRSRPATQLVATLAVAADGRNSRVREAAGIAVDTWSYDQAALVCNIRHTLAAPRYLDRVPHRTRAVHARPALRQSLQSCLGRPARGSEAPARSLRRGRSPPKSKSGRRRSSAPSPSMAVVRSFRFPA